MVNPRNNNNGERPLNTTREGKVATNLTGVIAFSTNKANISSTMQGGEIYPQQQHRVI